MADRLSNRGKRSGNVWVTAAWITITALILLAPLVAMQVTDEVNWTVSDFVFAGALLVGSGIIYELAARAGNPTYQAAVVVALGAAVLIMWVTGAVGVIGSEANPGNLLYVGLVALAIIATIVARGRAIRMVWAMSAAAIGQALVPVIAFAGVANPKCDVLEPGVFVATGFFAGMWLLSAWLFWRAAREQAA